MSYYKPLNGAMAALMVGGGVGAGNVSAVPLLPGSSFEFSILAGGSSPATTSVTVASDGSFYAELTSPDWGGYMDVWYGHANGDLVFNGPLSGLPAGAPVHIGLSDLDFEDDEALVGMIERSAISSFGSGPLVTITVSSVDLAFTAAQFGGGHFQGSYDFETAPPAQSSAPATIALLGLGFGLFGWSRRHQRQAAKRRTS